MKLCFQRSVHVLTVMENQRSPPPSQLSEVGVTPERRRKFGEMGDADDHWFRAQESDPSVSSPEACHCSLALPQSRGHHGKEACFVSGCHWLSLWKEILREAECPSHRNKEGEPRPYFSTIQKTMAWEWYPPGQPKSLFIIAMGRRCIFCTFISPGASFLRDMVDKELGLKSISPVTPGGYLYA